MIVEPSNETKMARGSLLRFGTRAQAVEDGMLMDVTAAAQDTGLRVPVGMSAAAYNNTVTWTDQDCKRQVFQQQEERLLEVIEMAAIRAQEQPNRDRILFNVRLVPRDGHTVRPKPILLKLVAGRGDHGEPVVTILMPDEA